MVTNFTAIPTHFIDGEEVSNTCHIAIPSPSLFQFGEYFGYSIAAPDLNGDG